MGKKYMLSYYVLYALFAIIGVVLVLFYGVGFNTPSADVPGMNEPVYTELFLYLKYALVVITIVLAVLAAIFQFIASLKDDPKGAVNSIIALALVAGLIIVCYTMGSTEPVMANGVPYNDTMWLKVTDMFLYAMYALAAITTLATIVNMSGIFKKNKF